MAQVGLELRATKPGVLPVHQAQEGGWMGGALGPRFPCSHARVLPVHVTPEEAKDKVWVKQTENSSQVQRSYRFDVVDLCRSKPSHRGPCYVGGIIDPVCDGMTVLPLEKEPGNLYRRKAIQEPESL